MIGGNIKALLQRKNGFTTNVIGEREYSWETIQELKGFLDMQGQSTNRTNYKTQLEESTHIFICDYYPIEREIEDKRLLINNKVYELVYIDNPMELNKHLELYLKYVGGQNGQR